MLGFNEIIQDPSAFITCDVWQVRESVAFSLLGKRKTCSYLLPFEWTHLHRSQVASSWKGRLGYGPDCLGPGYHALGRNVVCLVLGVVANVFCRWRACISDKTQRVCRFPLMEPPRVWVSFDCDMNAWWYWGSFHVWTRFCGTLCTGWLWVSTWHKLESTAEGGSVEEMPLWDPAVRLFLI